MLRVKRFNPLAQRYLEEETVETRNPMRGSGTIPRKAHRMPNLSFLVERNVRIHHFAVRLVEDRLAIEPEIAENENQLKLLMRYKNIHKWKYAKDIRLFTELNGISDNGLKMIGSGIATHYNDVRYTKVYFRGCKNITNRGAEILTTKLTRNTSCKLKEFVLSFAQCEQVTDDAVIRVGIEVPRNLLNLEHLVLKLSGCEQLTDKSFIVIGKEISKHLIKLQRFILYFDSIDGITPKGLDIFTEAIASRLVNLKQLSLSFGWCDGIGHEGIEVIQSNLAKYQRGLYHLTYNFFKCSATDLTGEVLGKGFAGNLSSLRNLTICLDESMITDTGAEALGSGIAKNLLRLNKLTLSFFGCEVSEECKRKLQNMLSFIPNVKIITKNMF